MAGGRDLKGITVSIGGDTTKLQSALAGVNKEVKNTQAQLKDVEKLLKLDPSNTELLSQKQKLLTQAISETKEKLTTLKTAAEQANEQLQKVRSPRSSTMRCSGRSKRRAGAEDPGIPASSTNATLAKIEEVGGKFEQVGQSITNAGKTLTTHVTAPILAAGTAAVEDGSDFDEGMSKVSAICPVRRDRICRTSGIKPVRWCQTKFSATERLPLSSIWPWRAGRPATWFGYRRHHEPCGGFR
jgi:phage-related minor tail protein